MLFRCCCCAILNVACYPWLAWHDIHDAGMIRHHIGIISYWYHTGIMYNIIRTGIVLVFCHHAGAALLTRESCRRASRICTLLFLPALIISSTGATLNPAALRDSWQLVVAGSLTIALSGVMAWAFGRLLLRPEARRAFRPVQLAIAFPNSGAFPLLLMESLCEQDDIKR